MASVLVLSHGQLANELVDAASKIVPQLSEELAALCLPWDLDPDEASLLLKSKIDALDKGEGVLIITDMFGGTATNLALSHLIPGEVEVITGVNLPMLVKLGSLRTRDLELNEVANLLTQAAQKSIRVASELLHQSDPS